MFRYDRFSRRWVMRPEGTPTGGTRETPQTGGPEPTPAPGQTPTAPTPPTPTPGAPGDKAAPSGTDDVNSLPEWAQKEIRDLRKEAATHRKAKSDAESAAQAAEEKRLADEKRWQELAEQRGQQVESLKQKADAYDALQAQIMERLQAEVDKWPDDIKALAPAESDAAAYMAWADKARSVVAKLAGAPPAQGNPGNPPAQGKSEAVKAAVKTENARFVGTRF